MITKCSTKRKSPLNLFTLSSKLYHACPIILYRYEPEYPPYTCVKFGFSELIGIEIIMDQATVVSLSKTAKLSLPSSMSLD